VDNACKRFLFGEAAAGLLRVHVWRGYTGGMHAVRPAAGRGGTGRNQCALNTEIKSNQRRTARGEGRRGGMRPGDWLQRECKGEGVDTGDWAARMLQAAT
jgi:hypothetical protein